MNTIQNEGIPEIGSMSMGKKADVNKAGKKSSAFSWKFGGGMSKKQPFMLLTGVAVIVVLTVILISCVSEGISKRKATEAVEAYFALISADLDDMDLEDIEYKKYYPDKIAEKIEKALEDAQEIDPDKREAVRIEVEEIVISKLEKNCNKELVEPIIEWVENEFDDIKLSKKDIKVSKGYIAMVKITGKIADEKNTGWITCLTMKVKGRYGVYMLPTDV